MNHRHLLPEEIDLLLDGEEGFGVAPLRNHLDECAACTAEYRSLAAVVAGLESLPLHVPSPAFSQKVMTQVQVFEPWHVALRDTLKRWAPSSAVGRVFAGATGGVVAVIMTFIGVWLVQRADAVLFLANLAVQRGREGLLAAAHTLTLSLFGDTAAAAIQGGGTLALVATVGAVGLGITGVAFGVKTLATIGRRRRS